MARLPRLRSANAPRAPKMPSPASPKLPKLPALRDRVKPPRATRVPKPPRPPRIPRSTARGARDWSRFIPAIVVAIGVAGLSWIAGWYAVPICAAAAALVWRRRAGVARQAMWGAVGGYVALLAFDSLFGGRTWALASAVGGVLHLPAIGFIALTLLFAAGLAWSAAAVVEAVVGRA